MRRGTATRPRAAMNVDYDRKRSAPFRHRNIGVELGLELHPFVICTDHGRIGIELLEIVRELLSLLEKRSLVRLQIEFIPTPNYVLLVWCQHHKTPLQPRISWVLATHLQKIVPCPSFLQWDHE